MFNQRKRILEVVTLGIEKLTPHCGSAVISKHANPSTSVLENVFLGLCRGLSRRNLNPKMDPSQKSTNRPFTIIDDLKMKLRQILHLF